MDTHCRDLVRRFSSVVLGGSMKSKVIGGFRQIMGSGDKFLGEGFDAR